MFLIETEFTSVDTVRKSLESKHIRVKEIGYEYTPKSTVSLPAPTRQDLEKLVELLTDHDDVQEVYTNLEVRG